MSLTVRRLPPIGPLDPDTVLKLIRDSKGRRNRHAGTADGTAGLRRKSALRRNLRTRGSVPRGLTASYRSPRATRRVTLGRTCLILYIRPASPVGGPHE